jgi:hypothetical protein
MTSEEKAINLLQSADIDKKTGDVQWHTWYKGIDEDIKKAFDIAIRHIQAWDKVKEEITQSKEGFRGKFTDESLKQIEYLHGRNEVRQQCLDIIDKHLQEVTNCE